MGSMEKSIFLPYSYCALLRLNMAENRKCHFVESSQIDFQENLWNVLWNALKRPFMTLFKLGFIMDKYGWKMELPVTF
jgi:hypothetical protein